MLRDGRRQAARALATNPRTVCSKRRRSDQQVRAQPHAQWSNRLAIFGIVDASMIMTRLAEIDEVPSPAIKPIPIELLAPFLHGGVGPFFRPAPQRRDRG
jgi:hypothetical protein